MITIHQWEMRSPREPLVPAQRQVDIVPQGHVVVRVAGCGVCHTDIGFYGGEVRTNHTLPLVLGHEISGVVQATGAGAEGWIGKQVIVPAILPCGACGSCARGRYALCAAQVFPGNDVHGGFASHTVVPARHLCDASGVPPDDLWLMSVVADAVSTPYEAVSRAGLTQGDLAVFVGAGGVGGFGVQIAAALGAHVVAIDPDETRRGLAAGYGASLTLDPKNTDIPGLRKSIKAFAATRGHDAQEWKVFETSGTTAGQEVAFSLLTRGSHLGVVGFTGQKLPLQLSRLMALDARAEGNWGCAPGRYPALLAMIRAGKIAIRPFVERRLMSQVNTVLAEMMEHRLHYRAILVPDFPEAESGPGGTHGT